MNQPVKPVFEAIVPLQQYKGKLIQEGYSYNEIKEANSVILIFKASGTNQVTTLPLPPISEN
jgi:hypothetical protein